MGEHARLSASSADRWMNCTGSPDLCAGKVSTTSRFAIEGTTAHELAEKVLTNTTTQAPVTDDEQEMLDFVEVYTTYCQQLMDEAEEHHVEKRVTLDNLYWDSSPPEPLFGTADFVAAVGETLHVVDFKYGAGVPVDAKENAQLAYYGLGAFFALSKGNSGRFTEVELTIIQPRAPHPDGPVRTWDIPVSELLAWGAEFKQHIDLIAKKETMLAAGSWCRFCPSLGDCPEAHKAATERARLDFGAIPKTAPETLPDDELAAIMAGVEFAQLWINAVSAEVQARLERGHAIKGWKLVPKRAQRKWIDESETSNWVASVLQRGRDEDQAYTEPKLKSPAQLEKVLKKFNLQIPNILVSKISSGVTLAPESDSRQGVASGPEVEFTSVPDDN